MLNWADRFSIFCFLDNNHYQFEHPSFEYVLGAGSARSIMLQRGNAFEELKNFYNTKPSWLFGHLGYGLKNEIEVLSEVEEAKISFGLSFFFEPSIVIKLTGGKLSITSDDEDPLKIYRSIENEIGIIKPSYSTNVSVQQKISKSQYINIVKKLIDHIHRGDCYEINYCQDFFAINAEIDPIYIYKLLTDLSPNPFAALYKCNDKYCLCASPERYLKKAGQEIMSQPMKGTSQRFRDDQVNDDANRELLFQSKKEKSENVMVVDLVRNDLSKICMEGSVYVDELFGIYSFPQVHQMISTIKGKLSPDVHWVEAIKATFPMGSMTGAPKKKVMELIDKYEAAPRGLFSGSLGYIDPNGDFDFNVVIRSIFYDNLNKDITFHAGSGITFYSNAEDEYRECMLKAEAIINVLTNS